MVVGRSPSTSANTQETFEHHADTESHIDFSKVVIIPKQLPLVLTHGHIRKDPHKKPPTKPLTPRFPCEHTNVSLLQGEFNRVVTILFPQKWPPLHSSGTWRRPGIPICRCLGCLGRVDLVLFRGEACGQQVLFGKKHGQDAWLVGGWLWLVLLLSSWSDGFDGTSRATNATKDLQNSFLKDAEAGLRSLKVPGEGAEVLGKELLS